MAFYSLPETKERNIQLTACADDIYTYKKCIQTGKSLFVKHSARKENVWVIIYINAIGLFIS